MTTPDMLDYSDYRALHELTKRRAQEAVQSVFPLSNDVYTVHLQDLRYDGPQEFGLKEQKEAILGEETLSNKLTGKLQLVDNATGKVVSSSGRKILMKVPYLTERGTYIRNGIESTVTKQFRLSPGVYSRRTIDGRYESQVNSVPGTGPSFRVSLDPATGIFSMLYGGRKVPLYPILRAMGRNDDLLKSEWGGVFEVNKRTERLPHAISFLRELREKDLAKTAGIEEEEETRSVVLREFSRIGLDPEVTETTLGRRYNAVNPDLLVNISDRLLRMSRNEEGADDRDSLEFQRIHDMSDFLSERIRNDQNGVTRKMMWKITNKGNLDSVPSAFLDKHLDHIFNVSQLAQHLEEINPLDMYDQNQRVSRLGEGAISELEAVPKEARNVNPSHFGFVDPIRAPESLKIGVDMRLVGGVRKGSDNFLYSQFINAKTGKPEWINSRKAAKSIVGFLEDVKGGGKFVPAIWRSRGMFYVPREDVEFLLPGGDRLFSDGANLVPLKSGVKGMRLLMGSKFGVAALPLVSREAPLVQTESREKGLSEENRLGSYMGVKRARLSGIVQAVYRDKIKMRYNDGSEEMVDLYDSFPYSRKTYIRNIPQVKAGSKVAKGDVLATSNYTDDKGNMALGTNLRVAYLNWDGKVYEDAVVISESASKKLTSEHMYSDSVDKQDDLRFGKKAFHVLFPGRFSGKQMATLGENGVVTPGTIVEYGDPLVLFFKEREPSPLTLGRRIRNDESRTWNHHFNGVVTDVKETRNGIAVYVRANVPMQVGDKVSNRHGGKGVVSDIVRDADMPTDSKGRPMDILMSPLGVASRSNSAQLVEAALGKIAEKTNRTYVLPGFLGENMLDFVEEELRKARLSDVEDITDPRTGKTIPKVFTGKTYIYKLQHTAEGKGTGRAMESYTIEDQPSKGGETSAPHIGDMEVQALLSHGATKVLKDLKLVKGQKNDAFWRQIKLGQTPTLPGTPLVYEKFKDLIRASGVTLKESRESDNIFAMTDADAIKLTGTRKITTGDTYGATSLRPIPNGLFDPDATGSMAGGNRWAYIQLTKTLPNPIMVDPLRRILHLSQKDFEAVVSGEKEVRGMKDGEDVRKALQRLDLADERKNAVEDVKTATRSKRDDAVKRLNAIDAMIRNNVRPDAFMMTRVPVLPPRFRQITKTSNLTMVADPNYMYKALIESIQDFKDSGSLPEQEKKAAEGAVWRAYKAVIGTGDPDKPELQQRNISGILDQLFGKGSPKFGFVQRRVIGTNLDIAGRAVITPNPSLRLDEVGLPEELAWSVYEPFVVRYLIGKGRPATIAAADVENRTDIAYAGLQEVVKQRPVLVNRAPTLHKYGIMAFNPVLTKGHTLQLPPAVTGPFNADFDGDSVLTSAMYEINLESLKQSLEKHKTDATVIFDGESWLAPPKNTGERLMLTKDATLATVNATLRLEDLPVLPDTLIEKENGIKEWDVPEGVKVLAIDRVTGKQVLAPVTKFSEHPNCRLLDVGIGQRSARAVTVSEDHSLLVYDNDTAQIERCRPEEAIGKIVPCSKDMFETDPDVERYAVFSGKRRGVDIEHGFPLSFDGGFFIGMMIGNGWIAVNNTACCSVQDESLAGAFSKTLMEMGNSPTRSEFDRVSLNGKVGISKRVNCNISSKLCACLKVAFGSGAENKTIPWQCLSGPKAHLLGLFSGLMNTDGTVSSVMGQRAGKVGWKHIVKYDTVSPYLRDTFVNLCLRLGMQASVTPYKSTTHGTQAYAITISLPDFVRFMQKYGNSVVFYAGNKKQAAENICKQVELTSASAVTMDLVPYPQSLHEALSKLNGRTLSLVVPNTELSTYKKKGYVTRFTARRFTEEWQHVDRNAFLPEEIAGLDKWRKLVENEKVTWKPVVSVSEHGVGTCYDITVPDVFTFATSTGVFVQDTASFSVPVSSEAVKEAYEKMMPSRNLLSVADDRPTYTPGAEYLQGLYLASRAPKNNRIRKFGTRQDAALAFSRGEIDIDDPIEVLHT